MNFLIDAQLPPALAARLRAAGHPAVHVTDILPGNAPDIDLLNHAATQSQVIISKDADFVQLAARRGCRCNCYGCGWAIVATARWLIGY